MSGFLDASASSSRASNSLDDRARSISRSRAGHTSDRETQSQASRSTATFPQVSSPARQVQTIPPFARYEPPSPPLLAQSSQPLPANRADATPIKRRRFRTAYDTSSSDHSWASDSDDDPPWWTFTQRGMMKMRARVEKRQRDLEIGPEAESGRENGLDRAKAVLRDLARDRKADLRRTSKDSRRNLNDSNRNLAKRSSLPPHADQDGDALPGQRRPSSTRLFRRAIPHELDLVTVHSHNTLQRSNSAPTSPVLRPSAISLTLVDNDVQPLRRPLNASRISLLESSVPPRSGFRQLTTQFPRFRRRHSALPETVGNLTDPEGELPAARSSHLANANILEETDTPARPKYRRGQTSRLRLNLPPPITHRFNQGFHAGTWQDALYGYYSEDAIDRSPSAPQNTPARGAIPTPEPNGSDSPPASPSTPRGPTPRRTKTRRPRRYRTALAPPTPSGLGFTSNEIRAREEGRVGDDGFVWPKGIGGDPERASGGDNGRLQNLGPERTDSRADTAPTDNVNSWSKRALTSFKRRHAEKRERKRRFHDEIGWKERLRRYIFLDARVTIWIRLWNLAVVLALLGLAVTIRLELLRLQLPGLVGSSTTLIIAYSSLTTLHVITAIYREYFGKPIGLWGLRSKMLWVCLDLLFVALWSSALSIATNDFIATPLACASGDPWWRDGLAQSYASLVAELELLGQATANATTSSASSTGITGVSEITHSLGITLPADVTDSSLSREVCRRQAVCIALSLFALLLYGGNMVLSLFRIFETVRRTANLGKAMAF